MWYSLLTCQCTSNTTMVSTPSARQRRSISLWPLMAASRQPWLGPGNSDRYIDGTCVILAASASLPTISPPMRYVMAAQRHRHVLRFAEHLVAPGAALTARARGLGAAEGLAQVANVLTVDEAHAGLDRGGDAMGTAQVLGPDVARKTILDVGGQADHIRLVLERDQAGHRAEDFFLGDAHAVVDVGENRGHHVIAVLDAIRQRR